MKKLTMACGLVLALLCCRAEKNMVKELPSGETTIYELRNFTGIDASGVARVQFTQGPEYYVEVIESGDPDIQTKVKMAGKTLSIETKVKVRNATVRPNEYPIVRITSPVLEDLSLSGATTLTAGDITGNTLHINTSGASKMEFGLLEYLRLKVDCSGACKMTGSIKTDDIKLDCNGASRLELKAEGRNMKVDNSGASKCNLTYKGGSIDFDNSGASEADLKLVDCLELTAHNSGASKFIISGNADKTKINASGVAKIDTSRLNQY